MDHDLILFLFLCVSCVTGLFVSLIRGRSHARGWAAVVLLILLVSTVGWFRKSSVLLYIALGMWLILVLLPGLIARMHYHRILQQNYAAAYRLARLISWLHPSDGWRQQPEIMRALELGQRGELAAASQALKRFESAGSLIGLIAMINLYRLTNQWEELLAWEARQPNQFDRHPQLFHTLLRARGETGDLAALLAFYQMRKDQISKLDPPATRDLCRLMLFAFCGKRELAERLFMGTLASLPVPTQRFWLATADLAAGHRDAARQQFQLLLPVADPPLRLSIEGRLSHISDPPAAAAADLDETLIADAALEHGHDEIFGAKRSLFSEHARVTQFLIVSNLILFAMEVYYGGSTNMDTLYRLGALFPPAVRAGEWWRLVASLFLHFGPLHLVMNMMALAVLGPFVEFALGARKFLPVYLLAGVGSMGMVMLLASRHAQPQLMVGASGCVMGLVGATGALMLRGWIQDKALTAKRRLVAVISIIIMQTVFDALVPQVSMTAHLSGALIGFLICLLLPNRLTGLYSRTIAEK